MDALAVLLLKIAAKGVYVAGQIHGAFRQVDQTGEHLTGYCRISLRRIEDFHAQKKGSDRGEARLLIEGRQKIYWVFDWRRIVQNVLHHLLGFTLAGSLGLGLASGCPSGR